MAIPEDGQPHSSPTHACDPTDFDLFVRSRIRELGTLCANMGHANFVAMDTEHGDGVSSIGLAFASKPEPVEYLIHPVVLTGDLEQCDLITHLPQGTPRPTAIARSICFNLRGFRKSIPRKEQPWGQADEAIDFQDVASKVMDAVRGFKEIEPERPLILVTYSSRAELSAMSTLVPQLHRLFSNWVDIQPLLMDAYHSRTNFPRLDGRVSLRHAMRMLGFRAGYQPCSLHHAGNDALRTLAIMSRLTHENVQFRRIKEVPVEHIPWVNKYQKEQNRLKGTERSRGLLSKRPGPPSRYPHVAKVAMVPAPHIGQEARAGQSLADSMKKDNEGQLHLPSVDFCKPPQVWDFFSPYEPSAIGRVCRENCYYVCVTTPEILQHLIEDLDRTSACPAGQVLLAEDVSDLCALGTAKREERAKRRQESERNDPE